jgi:hypothetical protein
MLGNELEVAAMKFLKKMNPNNEILSIRDGCVGLTWVDPFYKLDGLIFDQTENSFYIITNEIFSDSYERQMKLEVTIELFEKFIQQDKPKCNLGSSGNCSKCRKKIRRWLEFFDEESGIIIRKNNKTKILVLNPVPKKTK